MADDAQQLQQLEKEVQDTHAQVLNAIDTVTKNPWIRRYRNLVGDPAVQQNYRKLSTHPQQNVFLVWELAWLVAVLIIRFWRGSKRRGFLGYVFLQFWTFGLFLFGTFFLVPRLVFGPDYSQLVYSVIAALQK